MAVTAKSVRRIVAGNDDNGKAIVLSDGLSPDVHTDPARPGFYATRIWVTDSTPARTRGIRETLGHPHTIEPPAMGSNFRYYEFPPEAAFVGNLGANAVEEYFNAMGSKGASTYAKYGRRPYMQKTKSHDF
jgi:hypothetical protein